MLLKDTSQASIITVAELSFQGKLIASSTFKNTEVFTLVALDVPGDVRAAHHHRRAGSRSGSARK